jgi:hypothetical protein
MRQHKSIPTDYQFSVMIIQDDGQTLVNIVHIQSNGWILLNFVDLVAIRNKYGNNYSYDYHNNNRYIQIF